MKKKIIRYICTIICLLSLFQVYVHADEEHNKLYIDDKDGQLYYTVDGMHSGQFLTYNQMMPKESYEDGIYIENKANDTYHLYLQLLPTTDVDIPQKQLLDRIHFKIYIDDKLLYDGAASGVMSDKSNLSNKTMASLGTFKKNDFKKLKVITTYDINTKVINTSGYYIKSEYEQWVIDGSVEDQRPSMYNTQDEASKAAWNQNDSEIIFVSTGALADENDVVIESIVANTNWKFYAEREESKEPQPIDPAPDTSDNTNMRFLIIGVICSGLFLLYLLYSNKRRLQ